MSTTTLAARTAAPAVGAASRTVLCVPPQPEGAIKSWRRLIADIDPKAQGAFALRGAFLEPGVAYSLPLGAVVMVVDYFDDRWEIQMTTAAVGVLEPAKTWTQKSRLGKRIVDYVGRRLPAGALGHRATRVEARPNLYAGRCSSCRQEVAAGAGQLVAIADRTAVAHHPGTCPPPPPPPEVIEPNRYSEACLLCGCWVQAGEGVALLRDASSATGQGRYRAAHKGGCPPDAPPGPPNQVGGWCTDCGELVHPEKGFWLHDRLHHQGVCPPQTAVGPTWVVRSSRGGEPLACGQVRRVRVDLRKGDAPHIDPSVPGYRVLAETYIELTGVVLETVTGRRGRLRARVRPATPAEAADLLADEVAHQADARPDGGGVKARFTATKIYDRPWLAEITGREVDYEYRREFQRPQIDYTHSNRAGTRGAKYGWILRPNAVYETKYPVSKRESVREFLRVTGEGDIVEISKEEVEAWLNAAPTWHDH
ncbi:hypothetical protein [Streptomyces lydicus]|uniref:hypothetical protein n=1 Tax=Streptomyces lydicus TaxID=47763 RepID=UPI0010106380|nr:hypothetical protein [Streptomyces lydicus]MCZ1012255.1 hypothetical protein [Streptomyces lydicus]